jgi:hypothetical protein
MYEDFDQFVYIIENANPQIPIRKAVTGYDQLDSLKLLRQAIDTIEDYYRFIRLLDIALGYMCDIHAVIANRFSEQFDDTAIIDREKVDEVYQGYTQWTYNLMEESNQKNKSQPFMCYPAYIDGDYYLYGNYTLVSKEGDTLTLKDVKIISYKDIPYPDYVLKNISRYMKGSTRWDFKRNRYYSKSSVFNREGELVYENEDGKIDTVNFDKYYGLIGEQWSDRNLIHQSDFKFMPNPSKKEKKVLYFAQDKILYIYLNDMIDTKNTFIERVKEVGKDKELKKVILDVRGNKGGGDSFWHQLLKAIVADSLIYDVQMAFCNSELMRKRLGVPTESFIVQTFAWLPDTEFLVTRYAPDYFIPDSNSLKYKGKIYVLQDEDVFSAGHSLTSYCRHIEQLVSVGEPTGLLAGFGLSPLLYQLNNSKFSFRLEPAIDVTAVNCALDVYQDIPEIIIEYPFDEKIKALDYKWFDMQNENNLYKYDYLFQKVLKIEE